jgi:benzoate-CoA ligase
MMNSLAKEGLGSAFNFAQHLMDVNSKRLSRVAYIDDHGQITYGQLFEQVRKLASGLSSLGVRREERLMLLSHDCAHWPVAFLGSMYAGIVPVAVNTLLSAEDYAYMLSNSRSQALIVSSALLPQLADALNHCNQQTGHEVHTVIVSHSSAQQMDAFVAKHAAIKCVDMDALIEGQSEQPRAAFTCPDDPGFWLYSSGSTGKPKGALHTHANPYWTAELYGKAVLGVNEEDVCFSAAKMFFAYGLGNALSFPLSVGATTVLMAERPTPQAVFKRLKECKPTLFFGAPTGFGGMLASPELPSAGEVALRMCSSAGEALPKDIGERWSRHFGCEIIDGLGSTEMLHIFLSNKPGQVKYGTTGQPVPGYELELRGESGECVGDGEIGDLYIKGPSSALLYWNNRAKTRETFQGEWTKSGDKYIRDEEGYYTYAGRNDDMLKVSGIYVSPFEVEATLVQNPAVLEAAVIGVNDSEGLVKTKAFVVVKDGHQITEAELKQFVKDRLAAYKYPRAIEFVAELPKTATGKIQRFRLREKEQSTNGQA